MAEQFTHTPAQSRIAKTMRGRRRYGEVKHATKEHWKASVANAIGKPPAKRSAKEKFRVKKAMSGKGL